MKYGRVRLKCHTEALYVAIGAAAEQPMFRNRQGASYGGFAVQTRYAETMKVLLNP